MNIYSKFLIFDRLTSVCVPVMKPQKDVVFKVATPTDIRMMQKEIGLLKVMCFLKRMRRNKICIIALHGARIVYYRWISFEKNNLVTLQDREAYLFDAYTFPGFRKLGIHTGGSIECLKIARERDCERVIAAASPDNPPALKTLKKLGFRQGGIAVVTSIPLLRWAEYKRC